MEEVSTLSEIIVCGAGVIGLATAVMLARDGHDVTVVEADPQDAPVDAGAAWDGWQRRGVAQFRQPHHLMTRFRQVCDQELPDVTGRLLAAGCVRVDWLATPPPTLTGFTRRPEDDAARMVTGRRPIVEAVFGRLAADQPRLKLRRGVAVAGLLTGRSALPGVPHVTGVRTATGETIRADLVVDATGRRSRSTSWLTGAGARPPHSEATDRGFVYYTRFYTGPTAPSLRGRPLTPVGSISLLTLHGDNDTWSVTIFGTNRDRPLKALRAPEVFTRVVAACPGQAHWLDGDPITDVLPMSGALDHYRRFTVEGLPVVTGFAAIGDAWSCTNPSGGRGLSVGMVHAQQLRDGVRCHLDRPGELAACLDERTEVVVAPFHRNQVAADTARVAEMTALREGRPLPPAGPMTRLAAAAMHDPDAFRGLVDTVLCLAHPADVLARPAVQTALERHRHEPPGPPSGPDRDHLMSLLAA